MRALLSPRSIAVVGASATSRWSGMLLDNLERHRFDGALSLVNPRGGEAYGRPLLRSCTEVTGGIDAALLLVPPRAVETALRDAAAGGARAAVVLASGYAEAGTEGQAAQARLRALSDELGLPFLGPNGLGFASLVDHSAGWLGQLPPRCLPGSVAVISQSGNIATSICGIAARSGIGISHVVATGNEAVINLVDVADYLVELEHVRALAIFAEAISDPALFLNMAARAAELEKPIVVLKAGRSELGQRLASTHTGAMAGNAEVIDAALRSSGVVRVDSMEQLVATAGLLARTGKVRPGGLGMVSVSGGTNDLLADRAEQVGVELSPMADETRARIDADKPAGAVVQNPYDVTGGAARNAQAWQSAITAMLDDPSYGLVAIGGFEQLSFPSDIDGQRIDDERLGWITAAVRNKDADRRSVVLLNAMQDVTGGQVQALAKLGAPHVLLGIDHGTSAIAHAMSWSAWLRHRVSADREQPTPSPATVTGEGTWSEAASLGLFSSVGVPTTPFRVATSSAEAESAASDLGFPVVAKIASSRISHKSDVGGVRLDLRTTAEVATAYTELVKAGECNAPGGVDGVLIAPMVPEGVDLIVGVVRDADWGPLVLIGLGGVHAEAMAIKAIRLLPVSREEIRDMLQQLSIPQLLKGLRTTTPPDIGAVVDAVARFAAMADSIGPRLTSAEINPLRLAAGTVTALDGLVEWGSMTRRSYRFDGSSS